MDASARARLAWEALPRRRQESILAAMTQGREAQYRRRYPGLLSLGLGYKRVAGKPHPQLCLAFLVERKSPDAPHQLPRFVSGMADVRGRRQRVEIPTDVEELGDSRPHLGDNAADGIFVASPTRPELNGIGAVCCLVRAQGRPGLFALSCHHVLTIGNRVSCGGAAPDAVIADRAARIPYGRLADCGPMVANRNNQLDAAIAALQPGVAVTWNRNGRRPLRVDMGIREPANCSILAPRGNLAATFVKTWVNVPLPYPTYGPIRMACVYQFDAPTRPGDSGSPVMDSAGTLYAMHFWGTESDSFSLAIPAGYLFSPGLFQAGTLALA